MADVNSTYTNIYLNNLIDWDDFQFEDIKREDSE